ncbi:ComF family protein [Gloeothece verrucosa]|uniref:Phosphoribosyltransferase n=1 Tax=Gloeothece verrucosa (strain PCC 7822) TaxID=497965 RepID=E0UHI5_GLOV7|nr:ComF family protein [Gloeothece verrucosa]ADN12126.1 conserved hypothetical protein [Gloeothece verrucosa PCC 7822]
MTNYPINPQKIEGNWRAGWALDVHTISSSPLPDGSFDTVRSYLGELLYQLKYRQDQKVIVPIAEIVAPFIQNLLVYQYLSAIIPIPPSNTDRPFQPVYEIARAIGDMINLPVPLDYLVKIKSTEQLKAVEDLETRKQLLQGAMQVTDRQRFRGRYILLFDDLYRSGATLMTATDVLANEGGVARIFVLTLTRTRTKK